MQQIGVIGNHLEVLNGIQIKRKYFEQSKELIEKHKLFFIEDIVPFLPCVKSTFYSFFPENSDELDILKGC
jgi:hypothetical protein